MVPPRHPLRIALLVVLIMISLSCVRLSSDTSLPQTSPKATLASLSPVVTAIPAETLPPSATTNPTPTPTIDEPLDEYPTGTPYSDPATEEATQQATPCPTASPTPYPENLDISVWETQITLNSYGWEQALVPSTPDKPYAPYPELNFDAVMGPTPRSYQAIILENAYVRLTVIPELGGRILRWEDKMTGNLLTYANPVIKPTHWGYRGWWLSTGGIEWAFPVEEHGLNEYRPWQYELLSGANWRGIRVWDTDSRTGMEISIMLRLYGGRSDLVIIPTLHNPTSEAQLMQFWINAMLTLSGENHPSSSLRFWVPTSTMILHSTEDSDLPAPRSALAWPIHEGRDFSYYTEWQKYLGLFASEARGAVGAYDEASDQGIIRTYPPDIAQGVKIFCLGDLSPNLYTDDGSRYFEFWGGYNRTFFPEDTISLPAGSVRSWEEHWYPIHGIGSLSWARQNLAASLKVIHEGIKVGFYSPTHTALSFTLRQNENVQAQEQIVIGPGKPFQQLYPGSGTGWHLEINEEGMPAVDITP